MLSSSTTSPRISRSLTQASDSCVVNNETQKIHRIRKKSDRRSKASGSEGPRRIDSEKTRRRSVSLLEIKNLELDHSDTLLKDKAKNAIEGGYLTEELDQTVSFARRKRREKHRQKTNVEEAGAPTVITTVIGNLIEEETNASTKSQGEEDVLVGDWEYTFAPPKPRNVSCKQYVEQKSNNKFFPRDLVDFGEDECYHAPRRTYSPVNVAVAVQKYFRPIASLCCGILGGMSLWLCCTMIFWDSPHQESFMKYYPDCARAFQCLYYFLAIISLVSVLDSFDFSQSTKKNFWNSLPFASSPVIISFILMSTLILSLICAPLDDKLAMAMKHNWTSDHNVTSSSVDWDIEWWVTINYVRCVGAVLTWILFSLCLGPDALCNQLLDLLDSSRNSDVVFTGSK